MALWRPFRGNRTSLDAVEKHDGYVYFCVDDATLFFDYTDADGNLQRKQINSKDAETLVGKTLEELKAEFSSQSDWNQNDENAADYVKNRTHWVDGETVHRLDEKFIPDTIARTEHIHNNYGICSTGASTAAKTVQIDGFELRVGAAVYVKFTNSNSASNPTLNVSGTGAKPMYRYGTTVMSTGTTTTGWSAGAVQVFIYDGTGWVRDYWNNSTYSNASLGQGYGTCATAAATVAKTATLSSYALSTGGIVAIKFSNDVCANATLDVNSKGAKAIYYRGAAITDGVIKAGDIATFIYSTNYYLIGIDSSATSVGVITNEEIDEICGGSIQYAEDVMF